MTITLTCDCTACDGKAITASESVLDGAKSATTLRNIAHTYVQYAHGSSPLARVMCSRYDVQAV